MAVPSGVQRPIPRTRYLQGAQVCPVRAAPLRPHAGRSGFHSRSTQAEGRRREKHPNRRAQRLARTTRASARRRQPALIAIPPRTAGARSTKATHRRRGPVRASRNRAPDRRWPLRGHTLSPRESRAEVGRGMDARSRHCRRAPVPARARSRWEREPGRHPTTRSKAPCAVDAGDGWRARQTCHLRGLME